MIKFLRSRSLNRKVYLLFSVTLLITLGTALLFYFITFHSLQNEKVHYMENISANLIQNTEDIASSVMLMSETISNTSYTYAFLTETHVARKLYYQQLLNRLITRLIKSTSQINNILLIDSEETVHSFSSFDYSLASRLDQQYHILSLDSYPDGFTGSLYLADTDTAYYACRQSIYDPEGDGSGERAGVCVIICNASPLNTLCGNAATSEQALFAILDSDDRILACNRNTDSREIADIDSRSHLVLRYRHLDFTDWQLLCSVPYTVLYSELSLIRYLAAFLVIIPFLAFLVLAFQINTGIVTPLVKIVRFFQKEPYDVLHSRLEIKGDNEIVTLTENLNQMLNKINELTHTVLQNQSRMYEIELSKEQAQILALQSQINPHFLYNTLNSIRGLAYQGKCAEISTAVTSLSHMMRYNINGDSMTCVKNEFLCIEKYLQIIDLRFPNRFTFRLDMEAGIRDYEMPRFLLQPLVENAIFHGLEPRHPQKGTLTLTACLREDAILHFACADDGVGIPPDRLEDLRRKIAGAALPSGSQERPWTGIGLLNIHMRIQLIYGAPYGLSVSSCSDGTTVCADFPARASAVEKPITN